MKEPSNQALVGTEAIKAFLKNFDEVDSTISRIVVEELLLALLKEKDATKQPD